MRLIDADIAHALVKHSEKSDEEWACTGGTVKKLIHDAIDKTPTVDAVPVVRCKGCEKSGVTEFGKRYCKEPMGSFYGCIPVEDDYFCSGGRRRDNHDTDIL